LLQQYQNIYLTTVGFSLFIIKNRNAGCLVKALTAKAFTHFSSTVIKKQKSDLFFIVKRKTSFFGQFLFIYKT
jgi:hypothetical protein